jgi:hypothetical protein
MIDSVQHCLGINALPERALSLLGHSMAKAESTPGADDSVEYHE